MKLTSQPGESERDFRIRLQQSAHEARDAAVEKLRVRYAPKVQRLANKVRSAAETRGREAAAGAAAEGSVGGLDRGDDARSVDGEESGFDVDAGTRHHGRTRGQSIDERVAGHRARRRAPARSPGRSARRSRPSSKAEISALSAASGAGMPIETVEIKPKRGGVDVRLVSLGVETGGATRRLGRALSVHHLGRERLALAEVDEVLIGHLVRQQLRQILQRLGRRGRRNAAEERAELLVPLPLLAGTARAADRRRRSAGAPAPSRRPCRSARPLRRSSRRRPARNTAARRGRRPCARCPGSRSTRCDAGRSRSGSR